MNDKDIIKTQEAIIRLQEQVIYELLYDFVKASDKELKHVINKINIASDLKHDICN